MKSLFILIAAAVALTGCASTTKPYKPGATAADHQTDYDECNYEAMKATPNSGTFAGTAREISLIDTCMKMKGWRVVPK